MPEAPKQETSQGESSSSAPASVAAGTEQPVSPKDQQEEQADITQKQDSGSDTDKTQAISQNGGDSVKTDSEPTPNGKVSTSDMQDKGNNGDNCELENEEDALKSNGDVPSHQQAECVEGQEITKL